MLALVALPLPAHARRGGIAAEGCNGCHQGGQATSVRLSAAPPDPEPGQSITLTVEIDAVSGPVGGFYLQSAGGAGAFTALASAGTRLLTEDQIVHASPKRESGGIVRFDVGWAAPATPGGAVFRVWAVSANDSNSPGGDSTGEAELQLVYGCAGEIFTRDPDRDGFGAVEYGQKRDCSLPDGYARDTGDCAEYDDSVHPDAAERCNDEDDDCDGRIDEALPVGPQYTDADGDGHGTGATSIMDCSSPEGYAATRDDCDDSSAARHPDAAEQCDYRDDDCDGRTDEGTREECGVGWCRRLSDSCSPGFCSPGEPSAELCNALDDDCDGETDEQVACAAGEACVAGACTSGAAPAAEPPSSRASGAGSTAGSAAVAGDDAGASAPACADGAASSGACEAAAAASERAAPNAGCAAVAVRARTQGTWLLIALALLRARRRAGATTSSSRAARS